MSIYKTNGTDRDIIISVKIPGGLPTVVSSVWLNDTQLKKNGDMGNGYYPAEFEISPMGNSGIPLTGKTLEVRSTVQQMAGLPSSEDTEILVTLTEGSVTTEFTSKKMSTTVETSSYLTSIIFYPQS